MGLTPSGNHRAELVLFVFLVLGLVFQVRLARTKGDSGFFSGRPALEKRFLFALGRVREPGTKRWCTWLAK